MKIEIVVDLSHPPPLSVRVAPAPGTNGAQAKTVAAASGRTGNPRRRRGTKRGDGGGERPAKSAADLDAEMEDYTAANAPATAPATAIA